MKHHISYLIFGLVIVVLMSSCTEESNNLQSSTQFPPEGELLPSEQVSPPAKEKAEEQPELTFAQAVWKKRIDAAMAPSYCPPVTKVEYPSSYYQGPLIDTHLHIPSIPDWSPEQDPSETPEGRFGGPQALLGWNVKISEIACTINQEGTHKNFAFFPVNEGEISVYLLEIWNRTMREYPAEFTPFIMSSGNDNEPDGFPTVDAKTLQDMLAASPGLFQGYGEIGLYERENNGDKALPPDAAYLQAIYPLIKKYQLIVYFHPGEGQLQNFKNVLKQHQEIMFIVHGDEIENDISDLMDTYPNIYYTNDPSYSQHFPLFVGKSKEDFLTAVEKDFDSLLAKDITRWKSMIERHPDRFMWGTDRGDAAWNYDRDVGLFLVRYARAFIGRLSPEVQEKYAYKNAERLIDMSGEV